MRKGPENGRSWTAIITSETAIAAANRPIAIRAVRRLPLCTNAIANSVRTPSAMTAAHFGPVDGRLADDDPLAARVEGGLEGGGHVALRDDLPRAPSRQGDGQLQRGGQRSGTTESVASWCSMSGHSWVTASRI